MSHRLPHTASPLVQARSNGGYQQAPSCIPAGATGARLSPLDDARRADIALALEWGSAEQPRLDKLQRRAGWAWVRRQSLTWERRWRLAQIEGPANWPAPLPSHSVSGFHARAIAGIGDLIDTGLAFCNCIADFAAGLVEAFNRRRAG